LLTDIHTHLYHFSPEEIKAITDRNNIRIITSAYDKKTLEMTLPFLKTFKNIYLSLGIHPRNATEEEYEEFIPIIEKNLDALVAIGETGYDKYPGNPSMENQKKNFKKHLEFVNLKKLPLIIHCRGAFEDFFRDMDFFLITENMPEVILHSYSGGFKYLDEAIKRNFYISFGGSLTFKRSKNLKRIAKMLPLNRIVCETDSPFIPPETEPPVNKSTPAHIYTVLNSLGEIRDENEEKIKKELENNISRIFDFERFDKNRDKWIALLEESLKERNS